jgi:hypothetical protein
VVRGTRIPELMSSVNRLTRLWRSSASCDTCIVTRGVVGGGSGRYTAGGATAGDTGGSSLESAAPEFNRSGSGANSLEFAGTRPRGSGPGADTVEYAGPGFYRHLASGSILVK